MLSAVLMQGAQPIAEASGRLAIPYARELQPRVAEMGRRGEGWALLEAIAARTGGRVVDGPAGLFDAGDERRAAQVPVRTQVLLVTAALFMLDVLLRRIRLGRLRDR